MIADHDVLRALRQLFMDLGGDPERMPVDDPRDIQAAFADIGAAANIVALVGAWHDSLTNAELLPLIGLRDRLLHH